MLGRNNAKQEPNGSRQSNKANKAQIVIIKTQSSMSYLMKVNNNEFKKLKNNKGNISIRFRISGWISHLSDRDNFLDFFNEERIERCSEKWYPESGIDRTCYTIEMDGDDWVAFLKNLREQGMYANNALNELVKEYNKNGNLFEIKVGV